MIRHLLPAALLLMARRMLRWINLLSALLLVLMVWTGTAAQAAEPRDCNPVAELAAGDSGSDRNEVPSDPDKCVAHQHAGCGGHHIAGPFQNIVLGPPVRAPNIVLARRDVGRPGRQPDSDLRPPIA